MYEELIDSFLFGRMSESEEQDFLTKCKTNPELREEATMIALLVKGLQNK